MSVTHFQIHFAQKAFEELRIKFKSKERELTRCCQHCLIGMGTQASYSIFIGAAEWQKDSVSILLLKVIPKGWNRLALKSLPFPTQQQEPSILLSSSLLHPEERGPPMCISLDHNILSVSAEAKITVLKQKKKLPRVSTEIFLSNRLYPTKPKFCLVYLQPYITQQNHFLSCLCQVWCAGVN